MQRLCRLEKETKALTELYMCQPNPNYHGFNILLCKNPSIDVLIRRCIALIAPPSLLGLFFEFSSDSAAGGGTIDLTGLASCSASGGVCVCIDSSVFVLSRLSSVASSTGDNVSAESASCEVTGEVDASSSSSSALFNSLFRS